MEKVIHGAAPKEEIEIQRRSQDLWWRIKHKVITKKPQLQQQVPSHRQGCNFKGHKITIGWVSLHRFFLCFTATCKLA